MIRTRTPSRARLVLGTAAAAALLGAGPAHAEIFGLLNGRSAAPPDEQLSVEGGLQIDDDVFYIAARANYAVSPTLTAFANLGRPDFDNGGDGLELGGGVFMHLTEQRFAPSLDVAFKPSVGYLDADGVSVLSLGAEVLVSPVQPAAGSLSWYANAGLGFFRADFDFAGDDSDFEPIIGGGITLPVGATGTFYAGLDFIDDLQLGAGFRLAL